eukprot:TRINITY_DN25222_c0_g1_i1.p1 TRINITY_DN25222_c0_g1~~TRINITY_DN25222_c0_g1_i1.p1  ORF type:complete len:550 (-),score=57.65 TRINITY_DN25222_c0_g1_i1:71-1720(-)
MQASDRMSRMDGRTEIVDGPRSHPRESPEGQKSKTPSLVLVGNRASVAVHYSGSRAQAQQLLQCVKALSAVDESVLIVAFWLLNSSAADLHRENSRGESAGDGNTLHEVKLRVVSLQGVVAGCIDGAVWRANLGILRACDIVIATNRSTFGVHDDVLSSHQALDQGIVDVVVKDRRAVQRFVDWLYTELSSLSPVLRRQVKHQFPELRLQLRSRLRDMEDFEQLRFGVTACGALLIARCGDGPSGGSGSGSSVDIPPAPPLPLKLLSLSQGQGSSFANEQRLRYKSHHLSASKHSSRSHATHSSRAGESTQSTTESSGWSCNADDEASNSKASGQSSGESSQKHFHSAPPSSGSAAQDAGSEHMGRGNNSTQSAADAEAEEDMVTSYMMCNIPCRTTHAELSQVVDEQGFAGKYESIFLPLRGSAARRCSNLGYGFINFYNWQDGVDFARALTGYRFAGTDSVKVCVVKPSRNQCMPAKRTSSASLGLGGESRSSFLPSASSNSSSSSGVWRRFGTTAAASAADPCSDSGGAEHGCELYSSAGAWTSVS